MNKKEVLEIRKQFSPENCAITRISVDAMSITKKEKMEMKKSLLIFTGRRGFQIF